MPTSDWWCPGCLVGRHVDLVGLEPHTAESLNRSAQWPCLSVYSLCPTTMAALLSFIRDPRCESSREPWLFVR